MFSSVIHPASFLRAVVGTVPFEEYCRLRAIPFAPRPGDGHDRPLDRWAAALAALPPDAQARVEFELAQVQELSGPDAGAHLLDAAAGGTLPTDDVPGGNPLALWFLVHRPDLFQEVFFHHEVAEVESWRTARAAADLPVGDLAAKARELGEEVRAFFRRSAGTGRFCAVEARRLPDAVCFAARVADRIQLVEAFSEDGAPSLKRLCPALTVLFAYRPCDGTVRLKSPLRAADRVQELFQRFGLSVLGQPVTGFGEGFDLDRLKRPILLLPDAGDMEAVRVRALHLRYPARMNRRGIRLESPSGDHPDAIGELLRAHVGERAGELAVWYAELQVRLRVGDRRRTILIRLWPDRCNLTQSPLGDRLRTCLTRWGLRYA